MEASDDTGYRTVKNDPSLPFVSPICFWSGSHQRLVSECRPGFGAGKGWSHLRR